MDWSNFPFRTREERVAFNEAFCRHLNDVKAEWVRRDLPTAGFRCECVTLHCDSRLPLSAKHWEEACSQPGRFVVAPEHVASDVEVVVKEYPDFWIVEKQGRAEEVAEKLD